MTKGINDPLIGYALNDDDEFVGIFPAYPWAAKRDYEPEYLKTLMSLDTEDKAREYIAKALAPYCDDSLEYLKNACDYIATTWWA